MHDVRPVRKPLAHCPAERFPSGRAAPPAIRFGIPVGNRLWLAKRSLAGQHATGFRTGLFEPVFTRRTCTALPPSCEYKFFEFAGFRLAKALKLLIFRDMKRTWVFLCSVSRLSATGGSFYFPRDFCNLYKCSRREARKSSTRCVKIL